MTNAGATADDPAYQAAVTDLLGVLAYGELMSSLELAAAGLEAPTLTMAGKLAALGHRKYGQHLHLIERLAGLGVSGESAMGPFVAAFRSYHERTEPNGWLEALVKAYVGEGISRDFYREMAAFVDAETKAVMDAALDDAEADAFIVTMIRDAIAVDHTAAGRLALWGRRLVGEALSQGQTVAVTRDSLSGLLLGGHADLIEVGAMFDRLMTEHQTRMARLGLDA